MQLRGTQRAANSQKSVLQTNAHEVVEVSGNELITLHIAKRDKVGGSGGMPPRKILNIRCSEVHSGAS